MRVREADRSTHPVDLFDVLVSAGVVGLTSLQIFERETPRATAWLGYVMAVALLGRRRWPIRAWARSPAMTVGII